MTRTSMELSELLQKQNGGDFPRSVAEAVLKLIMEADVDGVIGAGRVNEFLDRPLTDEWPANLMPGARNPRPGTRPPIAGAPAVNRKIPESKNRPHRHKKNLSPFNRAAPKT